MSETQDFLKDLDPKNEDAFSHLNKSNEVEVDSEKTTDDDVAEEGRFKGNRYTRREAMKAQKYKEEAIALNAKLQAITESRRSESTSEEAEYLKKIEKIFGDAGDDGKFDPKRAEATRIFKEALQDLEKTAVEKAIERLEAERNSDTEAVKESENQIDEGLEHLEDEYDADFSDSKVREGFLTLLEKVSPKDRDGYIKEYADFDATWELYQSRQSKSSEKAKELSSRSMVRGGNSGGSQLQQTAIDNFAKERGWA